MVASSLASTDTTAVSNVSTVSTGTDASTVSTAASTVSTADGSTSTGRHRVVIIGAGFGGLFGAKALKRGKLDVTIVDRSAFHLFQPLLYQVATGILSEGGIAPPTRDVLRRQKNAKVILGDVSDIDLSARTVTSRVLDKVTVTPYDSLIVAAGAHTTYFGHDEYAEHAPGMKTIDDALELRARIFGAYEMAELESDPAALDAWLTFVVVGAGPTGVELAGQIAELSRRTLRGNFRTFDPATTRVVLLDAADAVLSTFGDRLSTHAHHELEDMGVEVQLGAKVIGVDELGIEVQDTGGGNRRIETRTKIWAAGVSASELGRQLAEQTGAKLDRGGRVHVEPDLSLPGHPEVYVVGDMMALDGLPGISPVAIQGAKFVAKGIKARAKGHERRKAFHYFDKGTMATISRFKAVASIGPIRLRGFLAWVSWLAVHLLYLTAFKNRISALLHWSVSFIGRGRSERTSTLQQVLGRGALVAGGIDKFSGATEPQASSQRLAEQSEADASISETSRPVESLTVL